MAADRLLRLAARLAPASERDRYASEWAAEASELPPSQRLGYALRVLVRTPSLRLALRPQPAAALAGGGVLGTGGREGSRLGQLFALVLALGPALWGLGILVAGLTVRVACAVGGCVALEAARVPEDQEAFMAGPLGWTQWFLYSPFSLFVLGMLTLFGLLALLAAWRHAPRASLLGPALALAFPLTALAWLAVIAVAPEIDYVTNLTE